MDEPIQDSPDSASTEAARAALLPAGLKGLGPEELLLNEFFASIQGESTYAGWPCFFIRLAGCNLRCTWCDTEYAFYEGAAVTIDECLERSAASGLELVEVTGGEPLLQRAVRPLCRRLCDAGHRVLLETSGAVAIDGLDDRVIRIVDVKCPGSGMADRNRPEVISALRSSDELKFVLSGRADYDWAKEWIARRRGSLPERIPLNFSAVFGRCELAELAQWILEDRLPVRLNVQLHKIIWDPARRGV